MLLLIVSILVPKNVWEKLKLNQVNLLADAEYKKPVKPHQSTVKTAVRPQKQLVKDTIVTHQEVAKLIKNTVGIEQQKGLHLFLQALHQLSNDKHKKVRIGYFGDSMIEGDLITQTIRSILQNKFGGNGVGFIPISSVAAQFRQTVKTEANENWEDVHFNNNKQKKIIGISGHTFFAKKDAVVKVNASNGTHLSSLYTLYLLSGKSNDSLQLHCNNKSFTIPTSNQFNVTQISGDSMIKKAVINMQESTVPLFGLSAESKSGVILDNFSFRGTSGTELLRLNSSMLNQLDSLRGYDLVVLHYGPNLLYADSITNFNYYQSQLKKTIAHLKKAFPKTSFLIIGTADKAFKIDGEYKTGPGVEALLSVQQQVAKHHACAFYNLYEAMGGYNSMKTWAEKKPILAGNDYTHFNQSGSAKIGRLIANAILNEYEALHPSK
jgi:lysophospholipase L1-like esterase